jgi:branched-chain amino acid transport system substrate-binding protein
MRNHTTRALFALLLVLGLVAAACGRDDEENGSDSDDTTEDTSSDGTTDGTGDDGGAAYTPATTDDCDGYEPDAGITDDSIKIGSSLPVNLPFNEIAAGWQAWFDTANADGGVAGRQVESVVLDDNYEPANTVRNAQTLIDDEGVFALFNIVGTPNNLNVQEEQNARCVPNLFTATGSHLMSIPDQFPWTIGSIPTYPVEMAALVDYLAEQQPDATIAVLYQADDFGEGYFAALTDLIADTDLTIVADSTYTAGTSDVAGQVTSLAESNADVVVLGTTLGACPNALGAVAEQGSWDPLVYISATCTSGTLMGLAPGDSGIGVMSAAYLKDPLDPQWDDDEAMVQFREQGAAAGLTEEQLNNGLVGYGWTMGQLLQHVLETSPELTREAVMNTAWNLDNVEVGLLLPGITATTGEGDPYPIESLDLMTYNGDYWDLDGNLRSFEGESAEFSPLD